MDNRINLGTRVSREVGDQISDYADAWLLNTSAAVARLVEIGLDHAPAPRVPANATREERRAAIARADWETHKARILNVIRGAEGAGDGRELNSSWIMERSRLGRRVTRPEFLEMLDDLVDEGHLATRPNKFRGNYYRVNS